MTQKKCRKKKRELTREAAVEIFGKKITDAAQDLYETDFDKHFWSDLGNDEKISYIALIWTNNFSNNVSIEVWQEIVKRLKQRLQEAQPGEKISMVKRRLMLPYHLDIALCEMANQTGCSCDDLIIVAVKKLINKELARKPSGN